MNKFHRKSIVLITAFGGSLFTPIIATADSVDLPPIDQEQLSPIQALVQVLEDTKPSLSQKLQRLETDNAYATNINQVREHADEEGWFDAPSASTFLAVMHSITHPVDANENVLLGFEGTEQDAHDSTALDDNISDLVTAINNPNNAQITDPYLHFKSVLGEVQTTATVDTQEYYKTYPFNAGNIHLDPSSIEDRIRRYETDKPYYEALRTAGNALSKRGELGQMYYKDMPYLWGAYLDRDITWNILDPIIDSNDETKDEFGQWHATAQTRDDNVQAVFDCRADILPKTVPMDMESRADLYSQIDQCAVGKMNDVHTDFKLWERDLENDPLLQQETKDTLGFWEYALLRDAHTEDISPEKLQDKGLTSSDLTSYSLADNFNLISECRTELGGDSNYDAVHSCAGEKLDERITGNHQLFTPDNVHLDTAEFAEQLQRYDADPVYKKAVDERTDRQDEDDSDGISSMSGKKSLLFWSAFMNPDINQEYFPDIAEINTWGPSDAVNDNMQFVFECRNDILPDEMPTDQAGLENLYNQAFACAKDKTDAQYTQYEGYRKTIAHDPLYEDTNRTRDLDYNAYKLLQQAHTDNGIDAEQLNAAGLTASNDEINSLASNFNAVLECRAEQSNPSYESVHQCAGAKMDDMRHDYVLMQILLWSFGAGGLLLGAGGLGARRYHRHKNPASKH